MSTFKAKILAFATLLTPLFTATTASAQDVTFVTFTDIADNLQLVVDEFEKSHPEINVTIEAYPFNNMFEVIETKMQAGARDIDIFNVDVPLVANYAAKGYLEPLDSYFSEEEQAEFSATSLEAGTYNGQFLAAPLNSSSVGMYINVDLFERYGVEPPSTDPEARWTWDQTVEAAQTLTVDTDDDGQTDIWGLAFDQFSRPYQMLPLAQSLGGQGVSPDGLTASGYVNSDPWIEAAQFYQDLFHTYEVSPLGVPAFQSPELFKAGNVAMLLTGPWHVSNFNSVPELNWEYTPHPYFATGEAVTPTGSWHIGVSKNSEHKEAAAEFVEFLTLHEGNRIYFEADRNLPANRITLAYAEELAEEHGDNVLALAIYESQNTAEPRPSTPGYLEWEEIVARAFEDVRNGADPQQALDRAAMQIDRALARYAR
jgi:ABC-type glycerol-3-phosphate transport system substrate-binding protein